MSHVHVPHLRGMSHIRRYVIKEVTTPWTTWLPKG